MRRFLAAPCVLAMGLCACFDSGGRDDDPPASSPDAGPPAPPPVAPPEPPAVAPPAPPPPPVDLPAADISRCEDAPLLLPDAVMRNVAPNVGPAPFESCWSGSSDLGYFRLDVPARTGVEIVTRGEAPPVASLTDRCAPSPDSECEYFGPNGFFGSGETERVHYVGNPTDASWSLVVAVWWGQDWPHAPFDIETRSSPLPPEASCASPRVLAPGEIVPASPGGFFDACGNDDNGRFYRITVPPMSRATPLEEGTYLSPIGNCDCGFEGDESYYTLLENLTDAPKDVLLFTESSMGFTVEPMPPSARCESAPTLTNDGSELALDMDFAGHPGGACGELFHEGAHFVRVDVPAGTAVRVTARFDHVGFEQGTVLWARSSCAQEVCDTVTSSFLGAASTDLVLTAPADAAGSWVVGVAMTALPGEDQTAVLSASPVS